MTDIDELTRLAVHDTADLLSLVPYLLGYRPCEQLVFLAVKEGRVVLTGALPLRALLEPEQAREQLRTALRHVPEAMVLLAAWTDSSGLAEQAVQLAEEVVGTEQVLDSVVVGQERWRSRWGGQWAASGEVCDLGSTAVVAQAVVAGMVTASSREAVVAVVDGPGPQLATHCHELLRVAGSRLDELPRSSWAEHAVQLQERGLVEQLDEASLAELAVLAGDDQVLVELQLALRRPDATAAATLWTRVVGLAPESWAVAPLGMLGFCSWLQGQGAILVACVQRLAELDPDNRLGALLDALNSEAVPPDAWEEVRSGELLGG